MRPGLLARVSRQQLVSHSLFHPPELHVQARLCGQRHTQYLQSVPQRLLLPRQHEQRKRHMAVHTVLVVTSGGRCHCIRLPMSARVLREWDEGLPALPQGLLLSRRVYGVPLSELQLHGRPNGGGGPEPSCVFMPSGVLPLERQRVRHLPCGEVQQQDGKPLVRQLRESDRQRDDVLLRRLEPEQVRDGLLAAGIRVDQLQLHEHDDDARCAHELLCRHQGEHHHQQSQLVLGHHHSFQPAQLGEIPWIRRLQQGDAERRVDSLCGRHIRCGDYVRRY